MAPKIEASGAKKGTRMRPTWNPGGPTMDHRWTKVAPRARSGTTREKCVPKIGLWCHFWVHVGSHFLANIKSKNKAKIKCVWDGFLEAFWRQHGVPKHHNMGFANFMFCLCFWHNSVSFFAHFLMSVGICSCFLDDFRRLYGQGGGCLNHHKGPWCIKRSIS